MRAITILIILSLGGCTQDPGSPDTPSDTTSSSDGPARTSASLTLTDIPTGNDWTIVEIIPGPTGVHFEYEETYPLDAKVNHCALIQLNEVGFAFMGSGARTTIVATPIQRDPLVDQSTTPSGSFTTTFSYDLQTNETIQVLVAYDHAQEWEALGARLNLTATSKEPFQSRIVASGTADCLTEPYQFASGEVFETPAGTWVQDLRTEFMLNQSGFGWVFIASDLGYSYRVTGPTGILVEEDSPPGQVGNGYQLRAIPNGTYSIEVPRLVGQSVATTSYIVTDSPPENAQRFSAPPSQ